MRCLSALATTGELATATKQLKDVLSSEIEYELEQKPDVSVKSAEQQIPAGWKLVDTTGSARLHLLRESAGHSVRIDLDCAPMPSDEDVEDEEQPASDGGEDDDVPEGYRMLVSVTNPSGQVLQVGAFIVDHFRIHRVTLYASAREAPTPDQVFGGFDESPVYAGPAFDELADTLQNGFYDLLAAHGVTDDLVVKLADYCSAKEQAEYVNWLKNANAFLAGK